MKIIRLSLKPDQQMINQEFSLKSITINDLRKYFVLMFTTKELEIIMPKSFERGT